MPGFGFDPIHFSVFGKAAPQEWRRPAPQEDVESFADKAKAVGASGLGYVLGSIDKPRRALAGALAGKPREALAAIPFSDTIGITDPTQATSGAELNKKYLGVKDDNSWKSWGAGLANEIVLDPLNLVAGLGAAAKTAHGMTAAKQGLLGGLSRVQRAKGFDVAADTFRGTADELAHLGRQGKTIAPAGSGIPANEPLTGAIRLGLPFTGKGVTLGAGSKTAGLLAHAGDTAGSLAMKLPGAKTAAALFDSRINRSLSPEGRESWLALHRELQAEEAGIRGKVAQTQTDVDVLKAKGWQGMQLADALRMGVEKQTPSSVLPVHHQLEADVKELATRLAADESGPRERALGIGTPLLGSEQLPYYPRSLAEKSPGYMGASGVSPMHATEHANREARLHKLWGGMPTTFIEMIRRQGITDPVQIEQMLREHFGMGGKPMGGIAGPPSGRGPGPGTPLTEGPLLPRPGGSIYSGATPPPIPAFPAQGAQSPIVPGNTTASMSGKSRENLGLKHDIPGLTPEAVGLERAAPEWVNERTFYHGSATPGLTPEVIDPLKTDPANLYGRGIYTTESREIGKEYTVKAMEDIPKRHQAYIANDPTLRKAAIAKASRGEFDQFLLKELIQYSGDPVYEKKVLDRMSPRMKAQRVQQMAEGHYDISHSSDPRVLQLYKEAAELYGIPNLPSGKPLVYKTQSDFGRILDLDKPNPELADALGGNPHEPIGVVVKKFSAQSVENQQILAELMKRKMAYDAMTHEGGLVLGGHQHQVVIGIDPNDKLGLGRATPYKQWIAEMKQDPARRKLTKGEPKPLTVVPGQPPGPNPVTVPMPKSDLTKRSERLGQWSEGEQKKIAEQGYKPYFEPDISINQEQRLKREQAATSGTRAMYGAVSRAARPFEEGMIGVGDISQRIKANPELKRFKLGTFHDEAQGFHGFLPETYKSLARQGMGPWEEYHRGMLERVSKAADPMEKSKLIRQEVRDLKAAVNQYGLPLEKARELMEDYGKWREGPKELRGIWKGIDQATKVYRANAYAVWLASHMRNLAGGEVQSAAQGSVPHRGTAKRSLQGKIIPEELAKYGFKTNQEMLNEFHAQAKGLTGMNPHEIAGTAGHGEMFRPPPGQPWVGAGEGLKRYGSAIAQTAKGLGGIVGHPLRSLGQIKEHGNLFAPLLAEGAPFAQEGVMGATRNNPLLQLGHDVGGQIENYLRYSQYLGEKAKGMSPQAAGQKVLGTHFDYSGGLTPFERNVMRNVVPFYTYMRKNLPLQAQTLLQNPRAIAPQLRLAAGNRSQFVPEHLRAGVAIPLGNENEEGNQRFISQLGLPVEEAFERLKVSPGNPGDTLRNTILAYAGGLNPLIKGPLEQLSNTQFFSGRKLSDLRPQGVVGGLAGLVDPEQQHNTLTQIAAQALANTPATRFLTATDKLLDPRKPWWAKALNLGTGVRISDVDLEKSRAIEARKALENLLRGHPQIAAHTSLYVPPDQQANMNPELIKELQLYARMQRNALEASKAQGQR